MNDKEKVNRTDSTGTPPPALRRHIGSWDALVEHRIREAQQAGQFDNLPGFGKPLPDLGDLNDENWWIRRKLHDEGVSVLPPSLAILKDIQDALARLEQLPSEMAVRRMVGELNERIRKAQFAAIDGPPTRAMPLDAEQIVARWSRLRKKSQH